MWKDVCYFIWVRSFICHQCDESKALRRDFGFNGEEPKN
jgi:hypothetical protein